MTRIAPRIRTVVQLTSRRLYLGAAAGACATALLLSSCASPQKPAPAPAVPQANMTVSVDQAHFAPLEQSFTTGGEVRALSQITVSSKVTGRVQSVSAEPGASVKTGDVLAELDSDAATGQVMQAQAALDAATAKLVAMQSGGKPEDIAGAQALLAQQQARLAAMQNGARPEDVSVAQLAVQLQQIKLAAMTSGGRPEMVAQAQAGLDAANAKLNMLQVGATEDIRQAAQSAVDADRVNVQAAKAALESFGKASVVDYTGAQAAVDVAQAQLQAAKAAQAAVAPSQTAQIQAIQAGIDAATAQMDAATTVYNLLEASKPVQQAQVDYLVAKANASVDAANTLRTFSSSQIGIGGSQVTLGPCVVPSGENSPQDPNLCSAASTAANSAVTAAQAGQKAAEAAQAWIKQGGQASIQQAQLKGSIAQAKATAQAAQAQLNALKGGMQEAQRKAADAQVTAAADQLKVAQARLDAANNGVTDGQKQALAAQLSGAQEKLKADQARLDIVLSGPRPEELDQARALVTQAEQQLALANQPASEADIAGQQLVVQQAEQQLAKARAPLTPYDLEQQRQAVNVASAQARKAQSPFSEPELQAAQATVDQANGQLQMAKQAQKEATILAPIDGVILDRSVSPGALVGPTTALFTLAPPGPEVVATVDEANFSQLATGQRVTLEADGLNGQVLPGAVKWMSPAIDSHTRAGSVHIEPSPGPGADQLKSGMYVKLKIIVAQADNALVVPREALPASIAPGMKTTVLSLDPSDANQSTHVHLQTVRLGLVTDKYAEVRDGLSNGQLVATSRIKDLTEGDLVIAKMDNRIALKP